MELVIHVPDEVKAQAEACGIAPESYAERLVVQGIANAQTSSSEARKAAADDIRRLRKGVRLDGLKIKDLINEGRKY